MTVLLDKVLKQLTSLRSAAASLYATWFVWVADVKGGNRVLGRIAAARTAEELDDYVAEIRFALIFSGLGYEVEFEPLGAKGPDLKILKSGQDAYVEVTRLRRIGPGPIVAQWPDENFELAAYGDPERDVRKSIQKLESKFGQIGNDEAIIAVWNDDGDVEELEFEEAADALRRDADHGIAALPPGLLFMVYGSEWMAGGRHLYCYSFQSSLGRHFEGLVDELNRSFMPALIASALENRQSGT